jgi:hypothetical protein
MSDDLTPELRERVRAIGAAIDECLRDGTWGTQVCVKDAIESLARDLQAAQAQCDGYREANESVAVCAGHTEDIITPEDVEGGCYVCALQAAESRLAAQARVLRGGTATGGEHE